MPVADVAAGRLLVATPTLEDPHFARAVVLMLDHDEDGSLGVVISRPTEVPVAEVLPGWSDLVTGPTVLFSGGPVSTDSALGVAIVRTSDDSPVGWRPIYPGAGLVDLDTPPELLRGAVSGMRIFAGYSGWGAGQLESEIAEGAWYVVPAVADDLLCHDAELLWRRVLRRQPGDLAFVHTCPDDPTMN